MSANALLGKLCACVLMGLVTVATTACVPGGAKAPGGGKDGSAGSAAPAGSTDSSTLMTTACAFQGARILNGQSVTAYQAPSVPFGSACTSQQRVCVNGSLMGSYAYAACSAGPATSCSFNGSVVPHGQGIAAYQAASVPFGSACVSQQRVCTNGALSGSYTNSSCSVAAAAACTFNGISVAHGQSVAAYQAASVPYGSSCVSQQRVCTNGALSGSYINSSCSVAPAAACTFNGISVAHGQSVAAYQAASVPYGSSCVSQQRVCTNGALSGSYMNSSCSVAAPVTQTATATATATATQTSTLSSAASSTATSSATATAVATVAPMLQVDMAYFNPDIADADRWLTWQAADPEVLVVGQQVSGDLTPAQLPLRIVNGGGNAVTVSGSITGADKGALPDFQLVNLPSSVPGGATAPFFIQLSAVSPGGKTGKAILTIGTQTFELSISGTIVGAQ